MRISGGMVEIGQGVGGERSVGGSSTGIVRLENDAMSWDVDEAAGFPGGPSRE